MKVVPMMETPSPLGLPFMVAAQGLDIVEDKIFFFEMLYMNQ
jgi:hypothetical protein